MGKSLDVHKGFGFITVQSTEILEIVTFFTEQDKCSSAPAMQVEKRRFHISTFLTERDMYSFIPGTGCMWVDLCASSHTGLLPSINVGS